MEYMILNLEDWMGEDILSHLDGAMNFIEKGIESGGILVHWYCYSLCSSFISFITWFLIR